MIDPRVFIKAPIAFSGDCVIYPPSVNDVLTNQSFGQFVKALTLTQEDISDELSKKTKKKDIPPPFEFLLINCYHSQQFREIIEKAFWFFLHKKITIFYEEKMIILGDLQEEVLKISNLEDFVMLKEDNFFDFQNLIRVACGEKPIKPPEPVDPNEDPRITRIKAKARERDRIKAKKGVQGGISTTTCLVAICCMGIGITPLNIGEMSYAAIVPIMKMSQEKEKYDIDVRSLLAGAKPEKVKPKYWIRNSE